ncbi:MAG TPA: lytic transglycosylase domain-containing protein, partial [Planctomycetota bacterium]|nr:lytic transglycosylase domain-containing protein [Planctomycetota bacterium]
PPSEAELLDPATNLRLAASYLRSLQDRFGDLDVALAAYLKGPQWVEQKGGPDAVRTSLSSPSEIATYVHRVEDLAERLRLRAGASRAARRAVRWARPRRSGRGAPHPRRRGRRP